MSGTNQPGTKPGTNQPGTNQPGTNQPGTNQPGTRGAKQAGPDRAGMHVIATAGHVDHGKSTLVRALTGMEPDALAEERRRGMTIELGFAWTTLPGSNGPGQTVAFVDVPGHERFVSTMLAGVGPVPAVLFVVAADEGWMPQSSEHLDALEALGTRHGVLVVTRSDLMEPELALAEAQERLAASALGHLPAVCVSAMTGEGMDTLRTALAALVAELPTPDPDADVRLWVDRAFTIRGAGTVVTGTLAAGTLAVDDELLLQPGGQRVTVRALQCLGEPVRRVSGVARVAVNLRGVALDVVRRGSVLVAPRRWLATSVLDARLHPPSKTGPGAGPIAGPIIPLPAQLQLHIGAAAVTARPRPLGEDTVRLTLDAGLPLRIGDRALLRDPGRQEIAAGLTVLDVAPPPLRRRGAATARAAVLRGMDGRPDLAGEVVRRGLVRRDELAMMGVPRTGDTVPPTGDTAAPPGALAVGDWLLDGGRIDDLVTTLVAAVSDHDAHEPLEPGLPIAAAGRRLGLPSAAPLTALMDALVAARPESGLELRDGRVAFVSHDTDPVPAALREPLEILRRELTEHPFAAPETARLAELGLGPKQLAALVRAGQLDRLAEGVFLLPGAESAALEALAGLPEGGFTLSAARQVLGTSRRVAVPLLERLAKRGRTVRTENGDHRVVR